MNESPHQPPTSIFKYEISPSDTTYITSIETDPKINKYKTYEENKAKLPDLAVVNYVIEYFQINPREKNYYKTSTKNISF